VESTDDASSAMKTSSLPFPPCNIGGTIVDSTSGGNIDSLTPGHDCASSFVETVPLGGSRVHIETSSGVQCHDRHGIAEVTSSTHSSIHYSGADTIPVSTIPTADLPSADLSLDLTENSTAELSMECDLREQPKLSADEPQSKPSDLSGTSLNEQHIASGSGSQVDKVGDASRMENRIGGSASSAGHAACHSIVDRETEVYIPPHKRKIIEKKGKQKGTYRCFCTWETQVSFTGIGLMQVYVVVLVVL
jgi:hypothetical protein